MLRVTSFVCLGMVSGWVGLGALGCQPSNLAEPSSQPTETAETASQAGQSEDKGTAKDRSEAPAADTPAAVSDELAADLNAASEQQCFASAFVADTDPAGLNVRGGPGSDFAAIDTLPTDGPVEVTITGSANNWLQLTVAWSLAQQELEEPGWVYAPLLGVTTRSDDAETPDATVPLYAAPDTTATLTAEVPLFEEVSLLGCSGDWLEVKADGNTGWLAAENQCSSPVTTCP